MNLCRSNHWVVRLVAAGTFIVLTGTAAAQQTEKIQEDFYGKKATELFSALQTQYGLQIFSGTDQIDSLPINMHTSGLDVTQVLDSLLFPSDLHYKIDSYKRIFISSQPVTLHTNFPTGFFDESHSARTNLPTVNKDPDERFTTASDTIQIGSLTGRPSAEKLSLTGFIRQRETGAALPAITMTVDSGKLSVLTDESGYYTLQLTPGYHRIRITGAGLEPVTKLVQLHNEGRLDVELENDVPSLKAVLVTSARNSSIRNLQMGVNKLSIANIRKVPSVFGEADVLKVLLALPGVTSAGEGANGFNVRGGATDQNLVLFGGGTIYNPAHLFGFFSAFNPDVVSDIALYKSDLPERYGGRISSILDVSVVEPNKKEWVGVAGIGPLTSKITVQGPLKKEKTSLLLGGRTTYSNWLFDVIPDKRYRKSRAAFSDFNIALHHQINQKNIIRFNGYYSRDYFRLNTDTSYRYGNLSLNTSWQWFLNNRLSGNFWIGFDKYHYGIDYLQNPVNAFKLSFGVQQEQLRLDFHYRPGNHHQLRFGLNSIYYQLQPGSYLPEGAASIVQANVVPQEQALESAVFIGDEYAVSPEFSIAGGIRYSVYNYLGPAEIYQYQAGVPLEPSRVTGIKNYGAGKTIKSYAAPGFRLNLRYQVGDHTALKMGFNSTQQFIHKLSNTQTIAPTDTWKLSDSYIQPQRGWQSSAGVYQELKAGFDVSLELYYKQFNNYLDYKSGAELLVNRQIETDVFRTKGKSYGLEAQLKKNTAKWKGWLSYTFSRTFLRQSDSLAGESINKGMDYPASFDRPHNVNLSLTYQFSLRYSVSINFVYNSGRPMTLPIAAFNNGSVTGLVYGERNQYRLPDYIRGDIAFNLEGNHNIKQRLHNSWTAGIYNVSGRQNVYSVYYTVENGHVKSYQLSIFGSLIPFVTYTLKF